jgi:4-coumarate--CoA ligase
MPNTEMRVVEPDTGCDLGADERGEMWFRGPRVMAGYLNRPDVTHETIDTVGWLRTGELGYIDGDATCPSSTGSRHSSR